MKCDELEIKYVGYGMGFYPTKDVDAAIAELKAKLEEEREFGLNRAKSADHEIGKMCVEITELRAENRKLKRALWLARAETAKSIKWHEGLERYLASRKTKPWPSRFHLMADDEMYHDWYRRWSKVEIACLKKAKEYK